MNKLDQLVSDIFDDETESIGDETPFAAVSGWDSLKHVELVVGIETRFGVDLSADEIERMMSKRAVRAVLAAKGQDA